MATVVSFDTPSGSRGLRGRRIGEAGFTLVELLVAIWIMSIVAIIAWRGLSALVATRDRLGPEADDVRALLTGFGQMERDLAHAVNPVLVGPESVPVSVQSVDGAPAIQILRFSELLPDGASAVQQVTYAVIDGTLLRQCSPAVRSVQAAAGATPSTARLVSGVASMQVRVWRLNEGWIVPASNDVTIPPAVEVVVTRRDGTRLRRVLLVG
jgi:general secretion pathway protein J